MHTLKTLLRLFALGTIAVFALGAYGQNAAKGSGDTGIASASGQKVARDAQTGRLRQPTPEESRRLSQAMQRMVNRSDTGLTVMRHANGMKSVNLQDRFQSVAVAKTSADGVNERCVTNKAEVRAFTKSNSKSPKNTAEVK